MSQRLKKFRGGKRKYKRAFKQLGSGIWQRIAADIKQIEVVVGFGNKPIVGVVPITDYKEKKDL